MRRVIVTVLIIVFSPFLAHAAGQPDVEKQMVERAMEGQRMIFARDYKAATRIFKELQDVYPDHPIGYFGQMAVMEMKMLEREDFHLRGKFEAMAKKGKKAITKTRGRDPSDWDLLVCGSLLGLEGFYKARGSHWWDAYILGVKSRQTFKTILKRNPQFADAYFGTGMYIYWRSVYRKKLTFLRIFPDKRQEGIDTVQKVVDEGHFAKDLAEVNMGMVWMEERNYDKSHEIFAKYSSMYPKNVLLLLFNGRALVAGKHYDEGISVLKKLHEVDPSIAQAYYFVGVTRLLQKNPKYYDEAEKELKKFVLMAPTTNWKASGNYWLGRLEELRGNKARAKEYYEKALKYNPGLKGAQLRIHGIGTGL